MSELKIYGHDPTFTAWGTDTPQREPKLKVTVNWATRVVQNHRGGSEVRTPLITEPRYEIEGSDFILTDESYAALSQGFSDAQGQSSAFPFKNPIDYYCTAIPESYAEGVYQRGYLIPLGDGTGRIVKQYYCNGVAAYKTVLLPIAQTFLAYGLDLENNLVPIDSSGFVIDEVTGIVSNVPGVDWIPCDCEYRGRFRFDISEVQLEQLKMAVNESDRSVYKTISFRLIEDSYDKIQGITFSGDWNVNIDAGSIVEITQSAERGARIESSLSQMELREPVTPFPPDYYLEHGGKDRLRTQLILTVFNCFKGRLNGFETNGSPALMKGRLSSDSLTIEQLGPNAFFLQGETRAKVNSVRAVLVSSNVGGGNGDTFPSGNCSNPITVVNLTPFQIDPFTEAESSMSINTTAYWSIDPPYVMLNWNGQSSRVGFNPGGTQNSWFYRWAIRYGGIYWAGSCISTPDYLYNESFPYPPYTQVTDGAPINTANVVTKTFVDLWV